MKSVSSRPTGRLAAAPRVVGAQDISTSTVSSTSSHLHFTFYPLRNESCINAYSNLLHLSIIKVMDLPVKEQQTKVTGFSYRTAETLMIDERKKRWSFFKTLLYEKPTQNGRFLADVGVIENVAETPMN